MRHCTQCVIATLEVATGKILAPSVGTTEADFAAHIEQTLATDPDAVWSVFDARGGHLATLEAPRELAILAADREHVWGVFPDADGIPYVARFRVLRAGGGRT